MFKGSSNCQVFDKFKDYTKVKDSEILYDKYKLEFEGLRLTMVKDLDSYETWWKCEEKIDIIHDILLTLKAQRCICPKHPDQPKMILDCKVDNIHINFSDYIMVNLFETIDSLQNSVDPYLTLEEKLGGKVSNNEESKRSRLSSSFGGEDSSSEENEVSQSSQEEAEESGDSEELEKFVISSRHERSEEDLSPSSQIGPSSKSPLESGEDLVSFSEADGSEEDKEGGSASSDSGLNGTDTPEEPSEELSEKTSREISEEDSEHLQSSSYATARDVRIEESKLPGSSTTYRSFSESFGDAAERPDYSIPPSSRDEESADSNSSPLQHRISTGRLEKESLLASKVRNPKTYIGDISPKKDSPQDESAPLNIVNKLFKHPAKMKKERGKVELKALLCFQSITVTVSEQFSTEV